MEIQPIEQTVKMGVIVSGEKVHRPLMDTRLTAEDLEKARVELNETPEIRERLLRRFKEMLADEKIFSSEMDDNYLLRFLRTRKFDLERSYKLICNYFKFRAAHPDLFPRSPFEISDFLRNTNIIDCSPYRDHMGRAIFHAKLGNYDPEEYSYEICQASSIMLTEFIQDNPVTQINGIVGLWDFKGFTFKHFLVICSPRSLWKIKALVQDCLTGRYKMACFVNCHPLAIKAANVLKPFLKEKFRRRIKFFGPEELEGLHEIIDPCILPPEYGGRMPKWDNQDIVKCLFDKEQDIRHSRSFGSKT